MRSKAAEAIASHNLAKSRILQPTARWEPLCGQQKRTTARKTAWNLAQPHNVLPMPLQGFVEAVAAVAGRVALADLP